MFHDAVAYPCDFDWNLMAPTTTDPMPSMSLIPSSDSKPQERPFCCPVPYCDRRFHRKFTLREHIKTHTGEKPHECPIASCGKRFATSGNLARHKRIHTLAKLTCPVAECTRIFTKKEKLLRHLKAHIGDAPLTCQVPNCFKTFSTTGNLTRHMKSQHPAHSTVKSLPSPPSSPTLVSLPDQFAYDDRHELQHHYYHHQVSSETNEVVQPVQSETMSDHEIMELLDLLFVEPVSIPDCSTHASLAFQQQTESQALVYL